MTYPPSDNLSPAPPPPADDAGLRHQLAMERVRRHVFESVAREELLGHTLQCLVDMVERESLRLRAAVLLADADVAAGEPDGVAGRAGERLLDFVRRSEPAPQTRPAGYLPLLNDADGLSKLSAIVPGASAVWSESLTANGTTCGTLVLVVTGPGEPTGAERTLVALAAELAAFAIDRRRQAAVVARRSLHDPLTDLPNAALLHDRLDHAVEVVRRQEGSLVVLMIDLDDGLRAINESVGRSAGEDVLRLLAHRLRDTVRRSDTLARTGGNTFALVAAVTAGRRDAATLVRKVTDALAVPVPVDGREVSVGANVGVGLYPDDADSAPRLLQAAEVALHHAKRQGRNVTRFFHAAAQETTLADLELEGQLRRAVESALHRQAFGEPAAGGEAGGQLSLHYQPQVDPRGRIVGVEALARWAHPTLGRVPPDRFIAVAETSGLIVPFGEWALREALEQARRWRDRFGLAAPRVAVNVSAIQFATPRFVEAVGRLVEQAGVEPGRVELELTETVLMRDPQETADKVAALRAMGLAVAIDDFGTGYSSLSYLHRLTIDTLKVDRSFVAGLAVNDRRPPGTPAAPRLAGGAAVTRAIISMGRSLGMTVLAEGVETEYQRALLERLGCDVMQGYLFSPPVVAEKIDGMIEVGGVLGAVAAAVTKSA